jgi:hypothetical protein
MKDILTEQTIGNPAEIYEALYGEQRIKIIENEPMILTLRYDEHTQIYKPPITRKERRKIKRKK